MKNILKIGTVCFFILATISCKKEQNETEVITVDTTENVEKKQLADNATLTTVKFTIDGMTCAVGCAAKIEKSLNNMEGVATAKVDFESKTATVNYDIDKVNSDLLTKRVATTGDYKVSNIQTIASSKTCTANCKKECCAKKTENKTCSANCEKACCKTKV